MPHEGVLQLYPQVLRANQARGATTDQGGGDVKLGCSPVWNLAPAERSRICIYAFVETERIDNNRIGLISDTCDLEYHRLRNISSVKRVNDKVRDLPLRWISI